MQQYIADNRIILSLQGLCFVTKRQYIHSASANVNIDNTYGIEWNYKRSCGYMDYKSEEKRDKIFNKISKLIEEQQNPIKKLEIKKEAK